MLKRIVSLSVACILIMLQLVTVASAVNENQKKFDYAIAHSNAKDIGISKTAAAVSAMEVETRRVVADTNADTTFKAKGKNVLLMVCYTTTCVYKGDSVKIAAGVITDTNNNPLNLKAGINVAVSDLIASALYYNDINAARALAVGVGETESNFVQMMNQIASSIGMRNTHFTNVTGAADDNQKTTVEDLMILAFFCYNNSTIADITSSETHFVKTNELIAQKSVLTNSFQLVDTKSDKYNSNIFGIGIGEEDGGITTSIITYATAKLKFIFVIRSKKSTCYDDIKTTIDFLTTNYALVDIQKIIFEIGDKATVKIGGEDVYFKVMKNTVSQSNVVVNLYYSKSVSTQTDNYKIVPPDVLPEKVKVGDIIRGFKVMYSDKQVSSVSLSVKSIGEQEEETTTRGYTIYEKGTYVKPKQSFLKEHSWIFLVGVAAVLGIAVVTVVEKLK